MFSHEAVTDSLRPQGLQNVTLPCSSPSPGVCSNSCPLNRWCHPIISPSVVPFSSCPQSFSASGSFPMSWPFTSGGQSIGASASVLPVNSQSWFPLGLTGLISLLSKGLSRVFFSTTIRKHQLFNAQPSLWSTLTSLHDYWKHRSFDYIDLSWQWDALLFNVLSRFVTAFLPRSKHLLIWRLQSPSPVIFRAQENKICLCFHIFPHIFVMKWWDQMPWS